MTGAIDFYLVDVFAEQPLTGNPLAVVPDADGLTLPQLRSIAREFNQSETTFLIQPSDPAATWRLRSLTAAGSEVLGAGHNALGAWLWLADSGRLGPEPAGRWQQQIGADLLPVELSRATDRRWRVVMDQSTPVFGPIINDRKDELAAALALAPDDLDPTLPIQVVSTGAGHLLVPVRDQAAVDRARPVADRLADLLAAVGGEGCYLFTTESAEDAYARFFNPTMGITEDPATGTAAGPLAAALVHSGRLADGTVVIEQGHQLGRPSRLEVEVRGERVRLAGSGLVVGQGRLLIPQDGLRSAAG
jgi:trans-2,3-dihydro-3-hydroxyanthranilate isomerase